jgi:hypothetical protein
LAILKLKVGRPVLRLFRFRKPPVWGGFVLMGLILLPGAPSLFSQQPDSSTLFIPILADTTAIPDSASADLQTAQTKKQSDLEGPIEYEAQIIENLLQEKRTILTGKAKVTYGTTTLTAEKITVDWNAREMRAEGIWDSVWVVSETGDSTRDVQMKGAPQFQEGSDVMNGEVMLFNFETKKGRVLRGRMAYEDGFYGGQAFKMVQPKVFHVGDAAYTTCDLEENPHFHIWSQKMKIIADDKVVGKPIVMYLGKVPVLALPYLLFPIKRGRHSGLLIPRYGESSLEGRYLRGLGYYWAASEYWDVESQLDYFEKSGVMLRGNLNYNARYKLQGRVSGSITRKNFEALGTKEQRWDLNVQHRQEITPFTDFSVDARFVSSKDFYSDLSSNREHRMQQEIRSNAKLNHKWGRSGQIQLFMNQTRNLQTDAVSETFPKLTISNRIASLIPEPERSQSRSESDRWYQSIRVPYSFNILGERNRQESGPDTNRTVEKDEGLGWDHSLSFYATPKLFGWLSLKPEVSYKETWVDRRKHYFVDPETNQIEEEDERGFFALRTYNTSLSLNTKIYGMFHSRFVEGVLLRHVATPGVSFSFAPDFSSSRYGYYQTVIDTAGNAIEKDRYKGSLFRSTPSGEQQRMNLSLNNLFQMKIGDGEEAKKFDLFSYNLSTSYNWKADQYKFSDLSSRINANPMNSLSLSMNTTHTFYQSNEDGQKVDRLFVDNVDWSDPGSLKRFHLARLTSLDLSTTFRIKGKIRSGGQKNTVSEEDAGFDREDLLSPDLESVGSMSGDRFEMDESVSAMEIPWSFNSTLSYDENRSNPHDITKRIWMQANMEFNLTRNWKISYKSRWDLKDKKAVSQDLVFYRDLHCWEAKFVWTPTGTYKRFYFKINVKSPMLQDLKFEKGTGRSGLYGY